MAKKPPAPPTKPRPGLVLVGLFGAAVGLRGELRLQSFTQDPLAIADYGDLTDVAGARIFAIEALREGGKGALVARVKGVSDRNGAETLTNLEIYADRARMPAGDEDEYYISDLIGMTAVDSLGEPIGVIVDAPNYGAGDILEVAPVGGGETLLFPFTRAVVPDVDLIARRVTIVAPVEVAGEGDKDSI